MILKLKYIFAKYHFLMYSLIFLSLSLIGVGYLAIFNRIYYGADVTFHLNRFYDLATSITQGKIPLFNIYNSLPRGLAQMTYYPWLTLLPIVILVSWIKNAVIMSYSVIGIIMLLRYMVSFYSYRTLDKNLMHDFLFSLVYSNSGLFFNWEIRSMDWGLALASIFMPLILIGFIQLLKHNKYKMMTIGIIFVIFSHVLSGIMMIFLLIIMSLLNIYKFNIKKLLLVFLSVGFSIIATSVFWYPAIILHKYNHILAPAPFDKYISFGLLYTIGNSANYVYGLTEIIGIISIISIFIVNNHYHWFDIQLWIIGLLCILLNIPVIWDPLQRLLPLLAELQFVYRLSIISHLCFALLAVKLLTGKYFERFRFSNLVSVLGICVFLFIPISNEINYHFLMHHRPLETTRNINFINNHIWTKHGKNNFFGQRKFTDAALRKISKTEINNLDYSIPQVYKNKYYFNNKQAPIINNNIIKNIPLNDDSTGIIFNNKNYSNIKLPIALYNHVNYKFINNGHLLSNKNINHQLTSKDHQLVVKNLPKGRNDINIKSASLNDYPQKTCWSLLFLVMAILIIFEIYNKYKCSKRIIK